MQKKTLRAKKFQSKSYEHTNFFLIFTLFYEYFYNIGENRPCLLDEDAPIPGSTSCRFKIKKLTDEIQENRKFNSILVQKAKILRYISTQLI